MHKLLHSSPFQMLPRPHSDLSIARLQGRGGGENCVARAGRSYRGNWAAPERAGRRLKQTDVALHGPGGLSDRPTSDLQPQKPRPPARGSRGHGSDLRARALPVPDAPGPSGGCHHFVLVPGKQHQGLPASQVHTRGLYAAGRPTGGSAQSHSGPLCSGAGRLPVRSFHVQ